MTLDELPLHRREALLWRHALELDYDGVDDLVRCADPRPCMSAAHEVYNPVIGPAELGDDGRFHLRVDDELICAVKASRRSSPDVVRHRVACSWWTDGQYYRTQLPPMRDGAVVVGQFHQTVATWTVVLTGTTQAPELVPLRQRCMPGLHWPPQLDSTSPVGLVRAKVIAALGWSCGGCGSRGEFIDHDHFTGMVRGLLCKHCNTHIDNCVHVSGCPWADYLNDPPAASLQLRYPKADRAWTKPAALARIEYLGFDPFERGRKSL
ncbi:hypothetical protein UK23_42580 [Lentzea aerocolonigenes]|uniref:Recombination endonuclease VII n=1 Tax=Lentzea aerocolonigenes TaxID=68170 RepID=A0A0F0GCW1_LENAE|nr:endonuclease domain-containing protein [Lentzea aerocolonigenes]KJK35829.1 hypothetical protein UK23_42580 [Lentzea aerocolonigenes]